MSDGLMANEAVQDAILEYLDHFGFVHSAECLEAERQQRAIVARRVKGASEVAAKGLGGTAKEQIEASFLAGDQEQFLKVWCSKVPASERETKTGQQLEFDARMVLAVLPFKDAEMVEKEELTAVEAGGAAGNDLAERKSRARRRDAAAVETKSRMVSLRRYLESQGGVFSADETRCAFFALPHCHAPMSHPLFRSIVADHQVEALQRRLGAFLSASMTASKEPVLIGMFDNQRQMHVAQQVQAHASRPQGQGPATDGLDGEETAAADVSNGEGKSQNQTDGWIFYDREFVRSLYATAAQLAESLEVARKVGGPRVRRDVTDAFMSKVLQRLDHLTKYMDSCEAGMAGPYIESDTGFDPPGESKDSEKMRGLRDREDHAAYMENKYEDGASDHNENGAELSVTTSLPPITDKDKPFTSPVSPKSPQLAPGFQGAVELPVLPALDYETLKSDMAELIELLGTDRSAERQCCLLLQALRWRISRTPLWEAREKVIQAYVDEDVLHIGLGQASDFDAVDSPRDGNGDQHKKSLAMRLLESDSVLVKEYTVRFLNYLASSSTGRNYLATISGDLANWLMTVVVQNQWHFPLKGNNYLENVLGSLQRLSLGREFCREILTYEGLGPRSAEFGAQAGEDNNLVVLLLDLLLQERPESRRSRFANEHLAALLLNLVLDPDAASLLGQTENDANRCVQCVQAALSTPELDYMHSYMIAVLFSALVSPNVRELLISSQGQVPDYVHMLCELTLEASPLAPTSRAQLRYITELIKSNRLDEAMQREEEKRQEQLELEATSAGADLPDEDIDQRREIAPETEADEHPSFREANGLKTEMQGERLLCFGYPASDTNMAYRETKESAPNSPSTAASEGKQADILPGGGSSPGGSARKRSPIMRKFNKIPKEMQSKPKIGL